jgi:hypothetical protein
MVAARHPPVTTVAHDCVQLPEIAVRQEPAQESPDRLHVDFPVDSVRLNDGVVLVVLALGQFLFTEPASR